jgi:hypothetical protein
MELPEVEGVADAAEPRLDREREDDQKAERPEEEERVIGERR